MWEEDMADTEDMAAVHMVDMAEDTVEGGKLDAAVVDKVGTRVDEEFGVVGKEAVGREAEDREADKVGGKGYWNSCRCCFGQLH